MTSSSGCFPLLLLAQLLLLLCPHAVRSQRGFCTEDRCYAIFLETTNFRGAEERCRSSQGLLLRSRDVAQVEERLFRLSGGRSGSFWLRRSENCSSVSVSADRSVSLVPQSCLGNLTGFLCSYEVKEPCRGLHYLKSALEVKYRTYWGFEVLDSDVFPMGTVALAGKPGGKYPDSKHVCLATWMQAPWSCEALNGGCDHVCDATKGCLCRAGYTLSFNRFTCSSDPCVECEHECQRDGSLHTCKCKQGYRLGQDRKSCVDIDECAEGKPCMGEDEDCINNNGGFKCICKYGYMLMNGRCVDMRNCEKCEQDCNKINGVFQCTCMKGFKVSPSNHTMCDFDCAEKDCMARCIQVANGTDCFCPPGYIRHTDNGTDICTDIDECENEKLCHKCENSYGSYKCSCNEGYVLYKDYKCKPTNEGRSSTSTEVSLTPAVAHPAEGVPRYVKMGSILGISVFVLLCTVLVLFVIRWVSKRCNSVQIHSFKNHNIDIFYLQQVTTETYKRLSFDKPKNDTQIL